MISNFTRSSIFALAVCISLTAFATQFPVSRTHTDQVAELSATTNDLISAWRSKDLERILGHFAENATIMEPGIPVIEGKPALRAYCAEAVKDPNFNVEMRLSKAYVAASGELGYVRGTFTVTFTDRNTGAATKGSGSFVALLRQHHGTWLIVEDISTSM